MFWLVENIAPHLLGGTVSNLYFTFFNLIFDEEVPILYVLGSFGGKESPVVCQVNRVHIVLKDNIMFNIMVLGLNKIECPQDGGSGQWHNDNIPSMEMPAMVLGRETHYHGERGCQGRQPLSFYTSTYSYVDKVDESFGNDQARSYHG